MASVTRMDHVGITVTDLDTAIQFFVGLGLELEGRTPLAGEFVDTVTGIADSRTEIAMLNAPEGGASVELSTFHHPELQAGSAKPMSTEVGIRNVAFLVDDIEPIVERLAADGYGLVGGIGEYENVWKMAYVRGPDGILVALAQRLG
jgi:catechol 2,3-dioxygenase-like lactoylglutathione lyase family enzyme